MRKVFEISLSPGLKKFVEKEFFDGSTAPHKINEGSLLGKYIYQVLNDRRNATFAELETIDYKNDEIISIELSDTLAKRSPSLLKLNKIKYYLLKIRNEKMKTWCIAQQMVGVNRYQAVLSFLKYYQIEDYHDIETAYQYITRVQNLPYKLRIDEKKKEED